MKRGVQTAPFFTLYERTLSSETCSLKNTAEPSGLPLADWHKVPLSHSESAKGGHTQYSNTTNCDPKKVSDRGSRRHDC